MCEKKLWIYWKNNDRQRIRIAKLSHDDNKFYFNYCRKRDEGANFPEYKDGIDDAVSDGFILFPCFPEKDKIYDSNSLFMVFDSRLPSQSRSDYSKIIGKYNISKDSFSERFDLLKKTGGRSATDSIEFIQPFPELGSKEIIRCFPLAGSEYYDICEQNESGCNVKFDLNPGDELVLLPDNDNNFDKYAVSVFDSKNKKIGYIPRFYSKGVFEALRNKYRIFLSVKYFFKKKMCPDCLWVKLVVRS